MHGAVTPPLHTPTPTHPHTYTHTPTVQQHNHTQVETCLETEREMFLTHTNVLATTDKTWPWNSHRETRRMDSN